MGTFGLVSSLAIAGDGQCFPTMLIDLASRTPLATTDRFIVEQYAKTP